MKKCGRILRPTSNESTAAPVPTRLCRNSASEDKGDDVYQPITQSWPRIIPFFDYPSEIRKVIHTSNAIESANMSRRKINENRSSFPNDEALLKRFYPALRSISRTWSMPIRDSKAALTRITTLPESKNP